MRHRAQVKFVTPSRNLNAPICQCGRMRMFVDGSNYVFAFIAFMYCIHLVMVASTGLPRLGSSRRWRFVWDVPGTYHYLFFAFFVPVLCQLIASTYYVLFDFTEYQVARSGLVYIIQAASISCFTTLIAIEGTTLGIASFDPRQQNGGIQNQANLGADGSFPENENHPFQQFILGSLFLDIVSLIAICGMTRNPFLMLLYKDKDAAKDFELVSLGVLAVAGVASSLFVLVCNQFAIENRAR